MSDTITQAEQDAAREEAYKIIDRVREVGFKGDAGHRFTDRQIWQAIKDSPDTHPYSVSVTLIAHVIEGRSIPEATYLPNREGA